MSLQLEQSPTNEGGTITNYTINFGPQHPAAHGVLRMVTPTSACSTAAPRS